MGDIAEKLLQAMQIVANKNLEAISFDTTIEATVEDVSEAESGKYLVSNGVSKFYAYSTETNYKVNDVVLVTIPEGNYDNQKVIIGKKVKDNETAIPYRSPFGHIIDITSNLIYGSHERGFYVNYSNVNDYISGCPWDIELKTFDLSNTFAAWLEGNNQIPLWDSGLLETPYTGYTRIGLQAQFSTWLSSANAIRGNYGLCLRVEFKHLDNNNSFYNFYYFDSDSFYGNPYNFETYYTQEAVFDISEYSEYLIQRFTLFAYQRNNFYDINDNLIEAPDSNDVFSNLMPNLYIKDPFVCLGYEDNESINDTAVLFTNSSLTYFKYNDGASNHTGEHVNENIKNIQLRWIHREETTKELHPLTSVPSGYTITWYRRKIGAPSPDAFAGAHYEIITEKTNQFAIENFAPDINLQEEAVKVIITRTQQNLQAGTQTEIIVAQSNILTFTNDQKVISQTDIEQLSALGIKFEDLQRGHYAIYRRDGKLQRDIDAKQIRYITAVFDYNESGLYAKALLNEATSIKWYYPIKNTMIKPYNKALQKPQNAAANSGISVSEDGIYGIWSPSATDTYHHISNNENEQSASLQAYQFAYTIKSTLNKVYTNNTIRLEVEKDGIVYTASITMNFNVAGSSGSAYTLDILWDDENNVIDLSLPHAARQITGQVVLYDENGELMSIPETASLFSSWYVGNMQSENVAETRDIIYPCSTGVDSNDPYLETLDNNSIEYYYYNGTSFQEYDANAPTGAIKYRYRQENESRPQFKYKKVNQPTGDYFVLLNDNYVVYESRFNNLLEENYKKYQAEIVTHKVNNDFEIVFNDNEITVKERENTSITMNTMSIFELVLTDFGDYDLTALFPIALKNGSNYQGIDGATSVRYNTLGDPDYIRNPYQLFAAADIGLQKVDDDGIEWRIYDGLAQNADRTFVPTLSRKNVLQPLPIYIADAPPYAVQAIRNSYVVWTQPILVYKDNYPSTTLNQWNGKDIIQNDDEGTIVANGIAAGKKESDNTFSGVMIGDWSRSDVDAALSSNTGIYGFNHGAVSYAFKDDGTAFIGKDGHGRITFNGNSGVIESADYNTASSGMSIDIDDGFINMKSLYGTIGIDAGASTYPLQILGKQNAQTQKYSYWNGTSWVFNQDTQGSFRVGWDGRISANGGSFTGEIHASSGTLGSLTVSGTLTGGIISGATISAGTISGGSISGASISAGSLSMTGGSGSLNVSDDGVYVTGEITANSGTIGGWSITESAIESSNGITTLSSGGVITTDYFAVNSIGYMGYLSSGIPGYSNQGGIGFYYGGNEFKVTSANAGFNFGNMYISIGAIDGGGQGIALGGGTIYLNSSTINIGQETLEAYVKRIAGVS